MHNIELTPKEISLVKMLLMKEEVSTRVEVHHARGTFDYSDYLKSREKEIHELLEKIEKTSSD